jgi:hypothetical protein
MMMLTFEQTKQHEILRFAQDDSGESFSSLNYSRVEIAADARRRA